MKKILVIMLTALFCMGAAPVITTTANAQTVKQLKKDAKKQVKKYNKEGWTPINSTMSLDMLVAKYNTFLLADEETHIGVIGNSVQASDKIGKNAAAMDARAQYCARVSAEIVGKIKSLDSGSNGEEIDKFGEAFEQKINQKLAGVIKDSFVLKRKSPDKKGMYEYQYFGTIDLTAVNKQAAAIAKETMDAYKLQSLSDQVADFIGDAMNNAE
ncbi:MAG: hypothetical protein KBT20_05170 [Bacteroidales bacterium]|nr:hypothetical protein [Candidatus Liminaster caballi]